MAVFSCWAVNIYGAAVFSVFHVSERTKTYKQGCILCGLCAADIILFCCVGYITTNYIIIAIFDMAYTLFITIYTVKTARNFLPRRKTKAHNQMMKYICLYPAVTALLTIEFITQFRLKNMAPGEIVAGILTGSIAGYIVRTSCVIISIWLLSNDKPNMHKANDTRDDFKERYANMRNLTNRQAEIFYRVLLNQSSKDMAATLYIAEGTIRNHLTGIYQKAGVSNRSELIRDYLSYVEVNCQTAGHRPQQDENDGQ